MFEVQLLGQNELRVRLDSLDAALQAKLRVFMAAFTIRLMGQVKINILALFRSAGPLYQSVTSHIEEASGHSVTGYVNTAGIPYARIQEQGGHTPAHVIVPRTAAVLAWEGPTGLVFAKRVNHPGGAITGRPYASLALVQLRGEFEGGMRDVVSNARATVWDAG